MSTMISIAVLVGATFVSEDLACLTAGQLAARNLISWTTAVGGCFAGIFIGDMGLWLIGRSLGGSALRIGWVSRRLPAGRIERLGDWFDRNALWAVMAARFVPGTRLPVYVAAGAVGRHSGRFIVAALIAALVWTPLLVVGAGALGSFAGPGWLALILAALGGLVGLRIVIALFSEIGRARLVARISLLWRWEFWPMIVFYPPVALWVAWLSVRYRGFTTITSANPGIPHGGFVGESKYEILSALKSEHVIHSCLLPPGKAEWRLAEFESIARQVSFPLIVKPDVGQRGAGVRLVRDLESARSVLAASDQAMIVQPYHPGPHEAGIFYYRLPGKARGRIFSITDKRFAQIIGDGRSTVEQLIWRHPRYRMQAATFLKRHSAQLDCILAEGHTMRLAVAGNHCQGTMFRDGSELITPALERAIDRVARTFEGFYFGRFDVRYRDVDAFKRGEDLCIIELNGITSESTNIYDPSRTLLWAYRKLFAQWSILFHIGAANRARGHAVSSHRELLKEICNHLLFRRAPALAD
jgi:membrane protein DedA with SNARE-associated domain